MAALQEGFNNVAGQMTSEMKELNRVHAVSAGTFPGALSQFSCMLVGNSEAGR